MNALLLLRPWWLLALIVPLALWFLGRRARLAGPWAQRLSAPMQTTLIHLGHLRPARPDGARLWLPMALALGAVALTGPAVLRPGSAAFRRLDPLILVLDLSPSVLGSEQGLTQLKTASTRLLLAAQGRPVGIMAYGADSYLVSPPTTDAESLLGTIAVLAADTMPVVGSRPDIALASVKTLFGALDPNQQIGIGGADVVVISDGGGMRETAIEAAARLQDEGARVWGVSLTENLTDAPPPAPQDLAALAQAGGGRAVAESETPALLRLISQEARVRLARDPQSATAFVDFGPWLWLIAMACVLPLYRKESQ